MITPAEASALFTRILLKMRTVVRNEIHRAAATAGSVDPIMKSACYIDASRVVLSLAMADMLASPGIDRGDPRTEVEAFGLLVGRYVIETQERPGQEFDHRRHWREAMADVIAMRVAKGMEAAPDAAHTH